MSPLKRTFFPQQLKNHKIKTKQKTQPKEKKNQTHLITNQWWNVGPAAVRGNVSIYFVELFLLQEGKQTSYIIDQNKIMCSW